MQISSRERFRQLDEVVSQSKKIVQMVQAVKSRYYNTLSRYFPILFTEQERREASQNEVSSLSIYQSQDYLTTYELNTSFSEYYPQDTYFLAPQLTNGASLYIEKIFGELSVPETAFQNTSIQFSSNFGSFLQ